MRNLGKKLWTPAATLAVLAGLPGCRSAYVQTAIVNHTGGTVHVIEVDYPSASFGTQQIAPNQTFNYRFKVQGSGPVQISYTGDHDDSHSASGPTLKESEQGSLIITLQTNGRVTWTPNISAKK
jgi:hypothetical protein